MQIIPLELSNFNFYCPVTGEPILVEDEPVNETAKSLQGYWLDEVFEEPYFNNSELEKDWKLFAEKKLSETGYDASFDELREFLLSYNQPRWVVFELTFSGMSCGPTSSTVWKVIDLDTVINDN